MIRFQQRLKFVNKFKTLSGNADTLIRHENEIEPDLQIRGEISQLMEFGNLSHTQSMVSGPVAQSERESPTADPGVVSSVTVRY